MDKMDEYIYFNYEQYKYLYQIDSTMLYKVFLFARNTKLNLFIKINK